MCKFISLVVILRSVFSLVVILRSVFSLVVILSPEGAKDLDSSVAPLPQNDDYVIVILRSVFFSGRHPEEHFFSGRHPEPRRGEGSGFFGRSAPQNDDYVIVIL